MKRKIITIVSGTMFAITSATMPASATVIHSNGQQPTVITNLLRQVGLKPVTPRSEVTIAKFRRKGRSY